MMPRHESQLLLALDDAIIATVRARTDYFLIRTWSVRRAINNESYDSRSGPKAGPRLDKIIE